MPSFPERHNQPRWSASMVWLAGSIIPSPTRYCRMATAPSAPGLSLAIALTAKICVPDIPIGKRGKRPAAVDQEPVAGGNLLPLAVFVADRKAAVVARPELMGVWLIFDGEYIRGRLRFEGVTFEGENIAYAPELPQERASQPYVAVMGSGQAHAASNRGVFRGAGDFMAVCI